MDWGRWGRQKKCFLANSINVLIQLNPVKNKWGSVKSAIVSKNIINIAVKIGWEAILLRRSPLIIVSMWNRFEAIMKQNGTPPQKKIFRIFIILSLKRWQIITYVCHAIYVSIIKKMCKEANAFEKISKNKWSFIANC